MNRLTTASITLGSLVASAAAQPSARVVTTLTDPVSGAPVATVEPGQTVRMRTIVSWDLPGSQLASVAGDMLATPLSPGGTDGVVSNLFSEFEPGGTINLGALVGDDLLGVDVSPPFCTVGLCSPVPFQWMGVAFVGYDWTAPAAPGEYEFGFTPAPGRENVRIRPTSSSPAFIELLTSHTPATLTIVPTPGVPMTLGIVAAFAARRSRRTAPTHPTPHFAPSRSPR